MDKVEIVKCSNCNKGLIAIIPFPSDKKEDVMKTKVSCCYCNDSSFIFDFVKGSQISGLGKEFYVQYNKFEGDIADKITIEGEENKTVKEIVDTCKDFIPYTEISGFEYKNGIQTIKTRKR